MNKKIQSIKGMHDCLPDDTRIFQRIEKIIKEILFSYGFNEIRTPIVEQTDLFIKTIGTFSDIVHKEMYTFLDKNGFSVSLRPENTLGCVRAVIQHNLCYEFIQRLWYLGPMFRYERPQMGRYRQFYQLGVEVFGISDPEIDAELIIMSARFWKKLGILNHINLQINSIGSIESRINYSRDLIIFLRKYKKYFDSSLWEKINLNPLRILDSKKELIQEILKEAPVLFDYLDKKSKNHFNVLSNFLNEANIKYIINYKLVRGLDYYNSTVFEWITNKLGSQNAICSGGRYDFLIEKLGGIQKPAIGFAIGVERLILLMKKINNNLFIQKEYIDLFLIRNTTISSSKMIFFSEKIRDYFPKLKLIVDYNRNVLEKQLKIAKKYKAKIVLLLSNTLDNQNIFLFFLENGKKIKTCEKDVFFILEKIFKRGM
ncbi:MAG: histidine--tRNA ligase [Arsenophonus sp.]|nr:MAG: histidine--tRNA ligase [Arsenophonus sp.]